MCRILWYSDKRGITAKLSVGGDVSSEPSNPGELSAEEQKRRLLSFLARNMAAAIAVAVLQEEGMASEPDVDACHDE